MRLLKAALLCASVILLAVVYLPAQTVTGTLSGHVSDPSGATVPKANVRAVNQNTGALREATSNDDGYFQINFLPVGSYDLTVNLTGFRTINKKGVVTGRRGRADRGVDRDQR